MHFFVCLFLQKRVSGLPGFLKIADQPPSLLVNKKNNFFLNAHWILLSLKFSARKQQMLVAKKSKALQKTTMTTTELLKM